MLTGIDGPGFAQLSTLCVPVIHGVGRVNWCDRCSPHPRPRASPAGARARRGARHRTTTRRPTCVFMQDMIFHHAQAGRMSDWAATHGARADLATLCQRIALSQRDEITLMQRWLHEHNLAAPDPLHMESPETGAVHDTSPLHMPGMDMGSHPMMMPGMLTPDAMRQLDAARGPAFDRLYPSQGMIKHHEGALIAMVAALLAILAAAGTTSSPGSSMISMPASESRSPVCRPCCTRSRRVSPDDTTSALDLLRRTAARLRFVAVLLVVRLRARAVGYQRRARPSQGRAV